MLVGFVPDWMRGKAEVNQERIQQLLEENDQLTCCIVDYQNKCVQYQHVLHRNLIYFATITGASPFSSSKAME
nr:SS18-like protein 2 [Marmota flaviventris]